MKWIKNILFFFLSFSLFLSFILEELKYPFLDSFNRLSNWSESFEEKK